MNATTTAPSKGDYKRLSKRIRDSQGNISSEDYEMLQRLRMTYKEPLSRVFETINWLAQKVDKDSVCTYRVKRIESIVSKLQRQKDMQVQRMADIAGCRCIMTSQNQTLMLYECIKKHAAKPNSILIIKGENNYIAKPKTNGYKSIHLNVVLKEIPDKLIEIQLRCLEQHNWATLVETSDLVYNSQLKEYDDKVNPLLYEFHQILSKSYGEMSLPDKKRISEISGQLKYLEKIGRIFVKNNIDLRDQRNQLRAEKRSGSYYLISTDNNGSPQIFQFSEFCEAEERYFGLFLDNPDNKNIVLTHFQNVSFEKISIAYSNYVMTYNNTLFKVLRAVGEVAVSEYNKNTLLSFRKHYREFWKIICIWFEGHYEELKRFNSTRVIKSSTQKKEWTISLGKSLFTVWNITQETQKKFKRGILYLPAKFVKRTIDNRFAVIQDLFKEIFERVENLKRNQN